MAPAEEPAVDNVDDVYLVERILADPASGWADAWDRYGHRLHSFCLRMLEDPAEADDAVADVFLVAAQRIGQLRQPEAFRAWLYAIGRRRVQRRWRERARTAPVDPHGATVMNIATDETEPSGADDAAGLLAAASAGLNDRDRELLALALGTDLDTTEMARVTGESVNAVSVRVTRLKDTVGRAAGALLVARHHRRDCDTLDEILGSWDGTFDTVWRKRIARHVDACDDCADRRRAAAAVFAAPLLLAPPSNALRDRVLAPTRRDLPDLGPWDDDGFPAAPVRRRWLPVVAGVAAAIVVAVAIALVATDGAGSDGDDVVAAETDDDADDETRMSSTSSTTVVTVADTPTTAATEAGSPAGDPLTAPTNPPNAPEATAPKPIEMPPPPTTVPAPPSVQLTVTPGEIRADGSETATATVVVVAPAGGASTTVSWGGPQPGSVTLSGEGSHAVVVGPFTAAPDDFALTVTATTTDVDGRSDSASATVTVTPVPG